MPKLIKKELYFNVKSTEEDKFIIRGIFSTPDVDRHGEKIEQSGWIVSEYMLNPVVLWAHDQYNPAIGKMIELGYDQDGNLAGAIQFAVEEYEFAKTIFNLFKGKYIRAFSVGFMNNKWEVDEANDIVILKENVLYEVSAVNVPANALALAASKGLDIAPLEKAIDDYAKKKRIREVQSDTDLLDEITRGVAGKIKQRTSDDKARAIKKAETPKSKGANSHRIKAINNAIRMLLKEKQSLKN